MRVEHTGLVRLDEHVGVADEVAQRRAVGVVVDVEHDAALATRPERIRGVLPDLGATGRLDLDDVGAEVGEQLADLRADAMRRQVDDAQTRERPHGENPLFISLRRP